MEINQFKDVVGVIPTQDITEGRFVVLTPHTFSADFGSLVDLPGVKLPATAEEAKRARYCLTWKVDNRPTPIYAVPSMAFALRGGFDQTANAPFATTVYLTHPGNQEQLVIASGVTSLAYGDGVFTLQSGDYIDSADIHNPGAAIVIQDTTTAGGATHSGKPKYAATYVAGVVGETVGYDATTQRLTIRIF
jgi:hypothetical protein